MNCLFYLEPALYISFSSEYRSETSHSWTNFRVFNCIIFTSLPFRVAIYDNRFSLTSSSNFWLLERFCVFGNR